MPQILSYGCTSSAGSNAKSYWESLIQGKIPLFSTWKKESRSETSKELLTEQLLIAWQEALSSTEHRDQIRTGSKSLAIILATTKGCIDDFIWNPVRPETDLKTDSLTPLLENFIQRAELNPVRYVCVSNACASSLAALDLATEWLKRKKADFVLVLAADRIGPFVSKGFQALQVLSPDTPKPFATNRDGLRLGEAAAAILLTESTRKINSEIELKSTLIDTESYAVTRPSPSGESLKRACLELKNKNLPDPDLIIAHGTGTVFNDQVEDQVFSRVFPGVPMTGTKWCIGHTLGASGAMDVIAGCETLKNQKTFSLASTDEIDPTFQGRYFYGKNCAKIPTEINQVLISSLGFGGIHAVAQIGFAQRDLT